MPHIHVQPNQHDHSVTGFIVRQVDGETKLMLHMHRKLGSLLPVGGHIELDETPWGAMAHELEEESGYRLSDLQIMQPKQRLKAVREITVHPQPFLSNSHWIPDDHFHTDLDYLFVADSDPKHPPKDGESTDIRWLSQAEIASQPDDKIMPNIRDISDYIFRELLSSSHWELVDAGQFRLDKISR